MTREIKANWNPEILPMGVSPDEVLLGWLRQPGNFNRFRRAGAKKKAKRIASSGESRLDVARSILVLLQNAGFEQYRAHGIVVKLGGWIRKYNVAHRLAMSGASEAQVEQAFLYYHQLVNHVENRLRVPPSANSPTSSTSTTMAYTQDSFSTSRGSPSLENGPVVEYSVREPSGENLIQEERRPVSRYASDGAPVISGAGNSVNNRSNMRQEQFAQNAAPDRCPLHEQGYLEGISRLVEQHHTQVNHVLDMHDRQLNRLMDRYHELSQSQSHCIQQRQLQTSLTVSLMDSMKNAGFSKEEISAKIQQLEQSLSSNPH